MKKQTLNGDELALLWIAFSKGLFPKPDKGEIMYKTAEPSGCTLFFEFRYFDKLIDAIRNTKNAGKFRESNAENDWNNLLTTLENSIIDNSFADQNLSAYELYNGSKY